jgi:hypothetical protein
MRCTLEYGYWLRSWELAPFRRLKAIFRSAASNAVAVYGEEIISIISARAAEDHDMRRYQEQAMDWRRAKVCGRISKQQAARKGLRVKLDEIPRLTDEQLSNMVRLRDAREPKVAVSVRLDLPGT